MVKLWIIPDILPLKIIPRSISVCMKILTNDKISTGLGDKLCSSYNIVSINPRRLPIVSSNTKPNNAPCGDISIKLPNVLKFGFFVSG